MIIDRTQFSSIFDVDTGTAHSFNDMAAAGIRGPGGGEVQSLAGSE